MVNCPLRCQEFTKKNTQPVGGTVECPICFLFVTNGRLLPCSHMYCSVCIDKMFHFEHQHVEEDPRMNPFLDAGETNHRSNALPTESSDDNDSLYQPPHQLCSYVRDGYDRQSNRYRTRNKRALQQQKQYLLQHCQQQQCQKQRQEIQQRLLQHQEQEQ